MRAKWERAVTCWNRASEMCPVLDLSSFAPVLTLPCRTCLHYASSVLAIRVSCHSVRVQKELTYQETLPYLCLLHEYHVIHSVRVQKELTYQETLPYLCLLHEYHVIHSVRYRLPFHKAAVGLGMYYPCVQGHTCTLKTILPANLLQIYLVQLFCF
jgi:hypothetical protein